MLKMHRMLWIKFQNSGQKTYLQISHSVLIVICQDLHGNHFSRQLLNETRLSFMHYVIQTFKRYLQNLTLSKMNQSMMSQHALRNLMKSGTSDVVMAWRKHYALSIFSGSISRRNAILWIIQKKK